MGINVKKIIFGISIVGLMFLQNAYAWFPSAKEPAYTLVKTWGTKGTGPGQFNEPTGIAVFNNQIYVSDSRNARIQIFDMQGNIKFSFGQQGVRQPHLRRPMNMTIANNELYVADYFNDQIHVYSPNGIFKRIIGKTGKGPGEFNAPGGVAVAKSGDLYVADFYNQRVQQLKANGEFIRQWGITGEAGTFSGKLNYPTDVALDKNDNFVHCGWL